MSPVFDAPMGLLQGGQARSSRLLPAQIGDSRDCLLTFFHLRLILFHDAQVIATIHMHTGGSLLLRMQSIGTDDTSFHQCRVNQSGGRTDLIFLALDCSLRQDDPTLALVEAEQMHRGCPVFSCPSVPRKVLPSIAT